MRVLNKSKRLVILNFKNGKAWTSVHVGAGATVEEAGLTESDVAHFVEEGSLEIVLDKKADLDPIVLAEPVNEETLKARTVEELKQYCKENKIAKFSKLDEAGLIVLILASLVPAE